MVPEVTIAINSIVNENCYLSQFPIRSTQILENKNSTKQIKHHILDKPYDGFTIDAEYENGKINGQVTIYNDSKIILAKLNVIDGKRNGICYEYDNVGKLRFIANYKDDVRNGFTTEYRNGFEVKKLLYQDDGTIISISGSIVQGYYEERNEKTNELICITQLDKQYRPHGKCYLYENNQIKNIQLFEQGNPILCLRTFDNNIMTEYDSNKSIVYFGGYLESFKLDYPKNGKGQLYENNMIVYSGMFRLNKKAGKGVYYQNNIIRFEGDWDNDSPNGIGILFDKEGKAQKSYKWEYGYTQIDPTHWLDYESDKIERRKEKMYLKHWRERGGFYKSRCTVFKEEFMKWVEKATWLGVLWLVFFVAHLIASIFIYCYYKNAFYTWYCVGIAIYYGLWIISFYDNSACFGVFLTLIGLIAVVVLLCPLKVCSIKSLNMFYIIDLLVNIVFSACCLCICYDEKSQERPMYICYDRGVILGGENYLKHESRDPNFRGKKLGGHNSLERACRNPRTNTRI